MSLPPTLPPERQLNWREACELIGCRKSHFYNLVQTGRIPARRFGQRRGVRVSVRDCLNFLQRNTVLDTPLPQP